MTTLTKPRTFLLPRFGNLGRINPKTLLAEHTGMVIQITPEGLVRFRLPHKRKWLDFPLARVYHLAAQAAAQEIIHNRRLRRQP